MIWVEWYCILMRYYPGLNFENIPRMTLWQFVQAVKHVGWLEKQGQEHQRIMSSADKIMGQKPGEVPSIKDIRALAKQINPGLVIPKD